jgi:hypothetical protein
MSVGSARTIHIQCIYAIFGREVTKYTVMHVVNIRFWPTAHVRDVDSDMLITGSSEASCNRHQPESRAVGHPCNP